SMTVTLALAFLVLSAWLMAVTVIVPAGIALGAVYSPALLIVPVAALPPVTLLTCHVTAVLAEPVAVAMNCCVAPVAKEATVGATLTVTGTGVGVGEGDGDGEGVGEGFGEGDGEGDGVGVGAGPPVTVTVAVPDRSVLMAA